MSQSNHRVKGRIDEVIAASEDFVDLVVSTDTGEVGFILEELRYHYVKPDIEENNHSLFRNPEYGNLYRDFLQSQRELRVDIAEMSEDTSLQWERKVGFPVMSIARIYHNGKKSVEREVALVISALVKERQNVALVGQCEEPIFTNMSEFYC